MKVKLDPARIARRGDPVKVGNVYQHPRGRPVFKVVVGIVERDTRGRPWNCIVLLCIDGSGNVVRGVNEPEGYVRQHQDLVGRIEQMPVLKLKWNHADANTSTPKGSRPRSKRD